VSQRATDTVEVRFGPDGLAPAVVQDVTDGRVLMLAWMDAEALAATLETGEVHFHSRSRGRLWRKGETSGNVLRLRSLATDCDADAILVTAEPAGPTCHRGTRSCFDDDGGVIAADPAGHVAPLGSPVAADDPGAIGPASQDFAWLETLWATIASRATERPEGSYTTRLLDGGVDTVGRKVTEEATEVLIAAKNDAIAQAAAGPRDATRAALSGEVADLLYHALVLLAERDVSPSEVIAVLRTRHEQSA
jgi:phosphoribosyl-AMP cyclohydrolase / phosphoribosyl-ATP pyrophosphohydrolase